MRYILTLSLLIIIQGCVQSTVGGYTHRVNGKEAEGKDYCMGNCLAKSEDGLHCAKFNKDIAEVCKEYLHD